MTTAFLIYLYLALGNIASLLSVTLTIAGSIYAVTFFALGVCTKFGACTSEWNANDVAQYHTVAKAGKKAFYPVIIITFLLCLYPSKQDMVYIIGGTAAVHGTQSLLNNEEVKALPENILKAANAFLEGIADESKD